jgi:putative transposase
MKFLRKTMKRQGRPHFLVTDKLRPCGVALTDRGLPNNRETGCRLNNRAENPPRPFRRRDRSMLPFRRMRSLRKFVAVHPSILNLFNAVHTLSSRENLKASSPATLIEWRQLCAV